MAPWGRLAAVVLVGALAATACSGGGSDDGDEATAATTVTCDGEPVAATTTAVPTRAPPPAEDRYTTANTPVGTLVDDPAALEVLMRYLPDLAGSSMLDLIRHTTLKGIQGYGAGVLTDDVLAQIDAELAELTPIPPEEGGGPVVGDVNYDEDRVGPYVLPDPFVLEDGTPVCDADTWTSRRRPEVLEAYERLVYGRSPEAPADQHVETVEPPTPAFGGRATRTQVRIELAAGTSGPGIDLIEYVPADAPGPVPMLLVLGFGAPAGTFGDPDLDASSPADALPAGAEGLVSAFPTRSFLDAGFGLAAIDYAQLDPDAEDGYPDSVRSFFDGVDDEADRPPEAWGAVAAWGWGLSRAMDHLVTDPAVDADRVAIYGASRLGRAVLWAGARDERFAAVIACCSGKFGGSLLRRDFGDSLDALPAYWFAARLQDQLDDIDQLPVDANLLLGLIAPRPVLLQTGLYDHAADPKGEFLAAVAASPVYELLGGEGLGVDADAWPPEQPVVDGDVGVVVHDGGHGTADEDWPVFLRFLQDKLS